MSPAHRPTWRPVALFVLLAASAAACESAESRAQKYVASGDAYEARRQYAEAIIEYRNAIKSQPSRGDVHLKLGRAYLRAGDPASALQSMIRAADLQTTNSAVQIETGSMQLLAGDAIGAQSRADIVLKREPRHIQAHVLLGNAQAAMRRMDDARATLERAVRLDPSSGDALSALGSLYLMQGDRRRAEVTLQRAVKEAPSRDNARLALANYYWMTGDRDSAERELRHALDAAPRNSIAQFALARLYEQTGRPSEAETQFKALAGQGGTTARLALADYYLRHRRAAEAIAAAEPLRSDPVRGADASLIVARAHVEENARAEAGSVLDAVIKRDSRNAEARLLKARLLLDANDLEGGLKHAKAAVKAAPGLPEAHYVLGLAHLRAGRAAEAEPAFTSAVKIDASHAGAELELSRIALARGDARGALQAARRAERHPDRKAAGVQLALSLAAAGQTSQARDTIAPLVRAYPEDPVVQFQLARIALAQRDFTTARAAFERVLQMQPGSMEALEGIVAAEAAAGKTDAAAARLAERTESARSGAEAAQYRVLAARLEIARNRPDEAVTALKNAIARDSRHIDAYMILGQLYASRGQLGAAEQEFRRLAAERPDAAANAHTMLGIVQQMQGRTAEATGEYVAALEADSDAVVAANNLAWIYAEEGRLDEALPLAQRAAARMPTRPEVQDTLGWVYYRKELPMHAARAFEKSAELAPQNPTYAYHLGLAYAKAERSADARRALNKAIALGRTAPWIGDARRALGGIETETRQKEKGGR